MFLINWKKNLFIFLYLVLFITSFSPQHQQMCAEFWVHNKDVIGFSSTAVLVVRKRILPSRFYSLFVLFNSYFYQAATIKLTCYSIKIIAIILMFLLKRLHHQMLSNNIDIRSFILNWNDSFGDTLFNIEISVFTKINLAETVSAQTSEVNCIDAEYETISYITHELHTDSRSLQIPQQAGTNEPSNLGFVVITPFQESKLHPSYMKKLYDSFNEKDRRRYAALEAMRIGHGGQTYISKLFGCDRKTIRKGIKELENFPIKVKHDSRIRIRKRKTASPDENKQKIVEAFNGVMENHKAGDPMKDNRPWTNLSRPAIADKMFEISKVEVSEYGVKKLLKNHNFGKRKVYKNLTRKSVENRNDQFEYIAFNRLNFGCAGYPVVSIDSKKKEFLTLYREGRLYTQETILCPDHDFPSYSDGSFTPYGIWDIERNKGFVTIGTNSATSEFACDSIKLWWEKEGRLVYPLARKILILCDGGGNNSSRGYLFKYYLQQLANEIKLEIRVAHYPPYCSKYNPIEHRMFPHVTRACQGVIFSNYEQVHEYIERTQTKTGLRVKAEIIRKEYEKGRKLTTSEIDSINLYRDDYLGKWNYTILPNGEHNHTS